MIEAVAASSASFARGLGRELVRFAQRTLAERLDARVDVVL